MKIGLNWMALALLGVSQSSPASAQIKFPPPTQVLIVPERTFIPPGFDDNDQSQIVVSGNLINTCYRIGPTTAKVDPISKTISIAQTAYFFEGSWCLQVLVPYVEIIDLGLLPAGNYRIFSTDQHGKEHPGGKLPIAVSTTAAADDLLYASVDQAYLDTSVAGAPTLVLSGTLPGDCMAIQEVRVLYRAENVIEVLPILEIKSGATCQQKPRPFEARVQLNARSGGSTLVHIRSMNGKAINRVFDL
jgi:hypothetical protein